MAGMTQNFKEQILLGIPDELPEPKLYEPLANHAPKRKDILNPEEKKLAIMNALRYFHPRYHSIMAPAANDRYGYSPIGLALISYSGRKRYI